MVLLKVDAITMQGMENVAMVNLDTVELQSFSEIIITKSNGAQHQLRLIMESDVPTGQIWISNEDSRVRRLHSGHKYHVEGVPSSLIAKKPPIIDFSQLNIVGYSSAITKIVVRAFLPRKLPLESCKGLADTLTRGVILYGPPGTGKSTIVMELCKYFKREPILVNGSELLDSLGGKSEEALRLLFKEAEKDQREKGDESPLHVFIFEELDSLFAKRTSSNGGSDTRTGVVNQLLTIMGGINPLNNILVFGTTNRLEVIEPALLRRGRFGLQIKIDLPNVQERLEILMYHLGRLRTNGLLDSSISAYNLQQLAAGTNNYSGADIAGLVKSAKNAATLRSFQDTVFDLTKLPLNQHNNIRVEWNDLMDAFNECEQLRREEEMQKE